MYHVIAPSPGLRTEKARPLMLNMFCYPNTCQSGSVHHCRGNPMRWKALGIHHGETERTTLLHVIYSKPWSWTYFEQIMYIYIYTYIIHPEKIIHPVHPKTFNQRTLGAQVSCGQVSIQLAPLAQAVTHFWWFNLKILGRKAMGSMGYFAPQKMGWYPSPSGSHAS